MRCQGRALIGHGMITSGGRNKRAKAAARLRLLEGGGGEVTGRPEGASDGFAWRVKGKGLTRRGTYVEDGARER